MNSLFRSLFITLTLGTVALLNANSDINTPDDIGYTALMYASANYQVDTVRLLLEQGANPNLINIFGNTALILAVKKRGYGVWRDSFKKETCEIVELLLKHGANPHVKNEEGKTALDYVIHVYRKSIIEKIAGRIGHYIFRFPGGRVGGMADTSPEVIEYKRTILKMLKEHGVKLTRWQRLSWKI